MEQDTLKYWIAFARFPKFGPARMKKILSTFPDLSHAWSADTHALVAAGIDVAIAEEFVGKRHTVNADKELELINRAGVHAITVRDEEYPRLLAQTSTPPNVLFVKGTLPKDAVSVGIVGTRTCSPYGTQVASDLSRGLASAGVEVISGLALGIDGEAHRACIDAGGITVGVLGSGVDEKSLYPREHLQLAERIVQSGGAVISEYPLGTSPLPHYFPYRNRIIAGLSLGVVVVEADEESGALITARAALDENRDVFAVPGSIYADNAKGPNGLLKMGARVATSAQDILDALNLEHASHETATRELFADSPQEAALLPHLSREPVHVDELIRSSGLETSIASSTLSLMEMKGKIRNVGGGMYVRAR